MSAIKSGVHTARAEALKPQIKVFSVVCLSSLKWRFSLLARDAKSIIDTSGKASTASAAPDFYSVYTRKLYTTAEVLSSLIQPCVQTVLWMETPIWPVFPRFYVQIKYP